MGLSRAGFDVLGIDIEPHPKYPFPFILADAVGALDEIVERVARRGVTEDEASFLWASPPCQEFTRYKRRAGHVRPRDNLIPAVRERLKKTGLLYAIENVEDAPLLNPVTLCGSMFALDVRRHRNFEANFKITQPACNHMLQFPRFAPATNRTNLRKTVEVGVWRIPLDVQRKAMGIDWLDLEDLTEAIPPAYSEYIGRVALQSLSLNKTNRR